MLARKTPIKRGAAGLARSSFKPKPKAPPAPAPTHEEDFDLYLPYGKASQLTRPKRIDPRRDQRALDECKGQFCYLGIPGICQGRHTTDTTVPAHRNEGKGMGLKVPDLQSVPACFWCHAEYDQGNLFTRDQKRQFFDNAYVRWQPVRQSRIGR